MATHLDLPEVKCPCCGKLLDAVTNADGGDSLPEPGCISVCIECQAILEFDDEMQLVLLTEKTKAELDDDTIDMLEQIQRNLAYATRRDATIQ